MDEDAPIAETVSILQALSEAHDIYIVTARNGDYREVSEKWLEYNDIEYLHLYMRDGEDIQSGDVVKSEIFDEHLSDKDVVGVFDDLKADIKMWREKGIRCFDVGTA